MVIWTKVVMVQVVRNIARYWIHFKRYNSVYIFFISEMEKTPGGVTCRQKTKSSI